MTQEQFVKTNGITLCFDDRGARDAPALVLVMGLGTQMISWPDDFVDRLVGQGLRVIRFDNRDCGRSSSMDHLGQGNIQIAMMKAVFGLRGNPCYHLEDMSDDLIGLMDALDIGSAHIAGASMGGMIAQVTAIRHPDRLRSLTSIMSAFGAHPLKHRATSDAMAAITSRPADGRLESYQDHVVRLFSVIGSPGFPTDEPYLRDRALLAATRGVNLPGTARQFEAVLSAGRQAKNLQTITTPTLVLHGEADPLIPVAAGRENAARIPGARLITWPGMGHDLPEGLRLVMADEIANHARNHDPAVAAG